MWSSFILPRKKAAQTRAVGLCSGVILPSLYCAPRWDVFIQPPPLLSPGERPPSGVTSPLLRSSRQLLHSFRLSPDSSLSCSQSHYLLLESIHGFIAITFLRSRVMQGGDRKATKLLSDSVLRCSFCAKKNHAKKLMQWPMGNKPVVNTAIHHVSPARPVIDTQWKPCTANGYI